MKSNLKQVAALLVCGAFLFFILYRFFRPAWEVIELEPQYQHQVCE